jgi:hypothetical protein
MSDSVRHLFPQLLANGYVPLANEDKRCTLPKWPTMEVDAAQCRLWARQSRYKAIGLRVEPPLLVWDLDLPDEAVCNAVRAMLPRYLTEGALERIGSPPKTAFFLRLSDEDEPFRELHTRSFHMDGQKFAVQVFGGKPPHPQLGAFGPHSHGKAGEVVRRYIWVGRSPADTPIGQLPVMRRAEVYELLDAIGAGLAAWPGMVVDEASKSGGGFQSQVYDLTEDMVYRDTDGNEYTQDQLIAEAKARKSLGEPSLRVTGSFTNDPKSTGSARAKVSWSKLHGLAIVDFKTHKTHRPVKPPDAPEVDAMFNEIFSRGVDDDGE